MVQTEPMSPTWPTDESTETMSLASSFASDWLSAEPRAIIAVMGQTGVGKTTFINTASGSNLSVGNRLVACTTSVQESKQFELDGRLVTLIYTPGFDDSDLSDVDVLEMIATFLGTSYKEKVLLAGVIYIHRISDVRMTGTSKRNFTMFRKLCGENALKNVVIVTTMWGNLRVKEEGEERERELQTTDGFFKNALEKGAKMARHGDPGDINSAHEILRLIIENHPLPLQIQQELVDQEKLLAQTLAGEEVNRVLESMKEKHEKELLNLQQDLLEATDKDGETRRELEHRKEQIRKVKAEIEKLKASKLLWVLGGVVVGGLALGGGLAVAGGLALAGATATGLGALTSAGVIAAGTKLLQSA